MFNSLLTFLFLTMLCDLALVSACQCDDIGSYNNLCDPKTGQCHCKPSFKGKNCNECKEHGLIFPKCNDHIASCTCDPNGTKYDARKKGSCISEISCVCKENVDEPDCSKCKTNFYGLDGRSSTGCSSCQCNNPGSFGNLATCNNITGQCYCKEAVTGKRCDRCKPGYYSLNRWNLYGCLACDCDVGGSVGPDCDDLGHCICKENFEGKHCNRLRKNKWYVPDYYHLRFEMESATTNGKPVYYRYNTAEFKDFSGKGYISFGSSQANTKLQIDVSKTRRYMVLIHYILRLKEKATVLVYLRLKDRSKSYVTSVDFLQTEETPFYAPIEFSGGKKEIMLSEGSWELDLSSTSSELLVDHIVLIPEEYYSGKKLRPKSVTPCLAGQPKEKICLKYKYIDLTHFEIIQAESGTNSKGYGYDSVKKTNLFKDPDLLHQLPVLNEMAELSPSQIALTLQVEVKKKDSYHLVVTYFNADDHTYRLDLYDGESGTHGYLEAIPCMYKFLCRAVVLANDNAPYVVHYGVNKTFDITFLGNVRGSLAIDYIALIPTSEWSPDFIIPQELCHMKDKSCLQNLNFQIPDEAIGVLPIKSNPLNPLTKTVYVVAKKPVYFTASVPRGVYVVVYQYYQPHYARFNAHINIQNNGTEISTNHVIPFCPANVGCRMVFGSTMELRGPITISFDIAVGKELWIDSIQIIPVEYFDEHEHTIPKRTELTTKFKRSCIDKYGLPIRNPPDGFCTDALITLTSQFTSKQFICQCNKQGSLGPECNRIGGNCKCRVNVVGKNCDRCKTGYYGYPNCKSCNCFIAGSKSMDCNNGYCSCKPQYTGRTCKSCKSGHWGFPDCKACNCDRRGSFTLMCRSNDGQCPCLRNYGSRACNKCQVGHFDFPYCRSCNCHSAGIVVTKDRPTGCYENNPDLCDCKANVEGKNCGRCKKNFYNLQLTNPAGCTACNCSSFGTIRGAGPCNKETGQCICQPNVIGLQCDACKDGFYVVKTDKVFSCQPCLCSTGGSVHGVCDKITGHCKCKPRVGGLKCDRELEGGYYLPSIGQFSFSADDIVPNAPREYFGDFDGAKVNGSFASRRVTLNVTEEEQSFFIMLYYSLTSKFSPRIDLEFSKEGEQNMIQMTQHMKAKEFERPTLDIVRRNGSLFMMNLTRGVWNLQIIFFDTFILNQITIVPTEQINKQKVSKYINNPCTIFDGKRYCSMYTYFDLKNVAAYVIQGEELSNDGEDRFDMNLYRGANIDGATVLSDQKDLLYEKQIDIKEDFYVIVQYINTDVNSSLVELSIQVDGSTVSGIVELFTCVYAFACRQVVLFQDDTKVLYKAGNTQRNFVFKVLSKSKAYLDFVAFIPKSKWNSNLISPSFYCNRRLSRCIDGTFPTNPLMIHLEAKKASRITLSTPPDSHPNIQSILLTTRRHRNLRWIKPMKSNTYYLIIHYYQPLHDSFRAKIIVMTHRRADAGKVEFKYCPSVHGCRAIVKYLLDDENQRFSISGQILRTSFTLPRNKQLWLEKVSLIPISEFQDNILEISPLDITRRYLRKCIGRQSNQIEESNREFCRSATFELTLGLNKYPERCTCNARGSLPFVQCNPLNGQCPCKQGYRGKHCSKCVQGFFPHCRAKSRMFRYSYFLKR